MEDQNTPAARQEASDRPPPPSDWPDLGDPNLVEQIIEVIATEGMVDKKDVVPMSTIESLGLDSMEVVMILNGVEEKFEVYIPMDGEITESRNLAEFVGILANQVRRTTSQDTDKAENTSAQE